jgi:hypothetical protein
MLWIDPDLKQQYLFQVERTIDYRTEGKGPIPETSKAVAAAWLKRVALI